MPSVEELLNQDSEDEYIDISPINDIITIDPETRTINLPASETLFGTEQETNVERKYFKCPKIVGDNIDLSKHQIYITYVTAKDNAGTFLPEEEPGLYYCEDMAVDGDYITFSWLLSGNVLNNHGFIAFAVSAKHMDGEVLKTRWKTKPAVGTVLLTVPDGANQIVEEYPDIITQLLDKMNAVEEVATPEAMQNYVDAYFGRNPVQPVQLDSTLTDNTKAAPAGMVGELRGDLVDLQEKTLYKGYISLGKNGDGSDNPTFYGYGVPIKKSTIRKVNVTIMAEQSLEQENVTLKCQIKNKNGVLLGEKECTVYARHYQDSIYEFIFDSDIVIDTDYGWIYVFSENYKLGYCTFTTTNINKDIVYDYQTNNVTGKYMGVLNGDWWNFNTDQSYQFNLCFELFSFDYNGRSIPLRNEERITKIEGKIVNDTVITVSNATELKETLDSIATSVSNNKANAKNRYTIQLNSGTYDMYSICKKSGYVDQEKFNRGIEIPDYVSLVGVGNVILECNIPDSDNTSDYLPSRIISVISTYGENNFENINFVATNCRYCVHDDNGGDYKYRTISFKNCTFKHNGVNNADVWPSPECYGAGYTAGRKGIFENCTFEGDFLPFYIHSSSEFWMTDKFEVSIKNCAFITTYENAIDLQDAYGTDLQGVAHIDNCYLTGKIRLSGSKPWTIYGGGNSNVEVSNENNSKIYLVNCGGLTESQVNNLIDAKLTGVETLLGGGF